MSSRIAVTNLVEVLAYPRCWLKTWSLQIKIVISTIARVEVCVAEVIVVVVVVVVVVVIFVRVTVLVVGKVAVEAVVDIAINKTRIVVVVVIYSAIPSILSPQPVSIPLLNEHGLLHSFSLCCRRKMIIRG